MFLLINLAIVILFIVDVVLHGVGSFSIGVSPTLNSISKVSLIFFVFLYVCFYANDIKKIILSPITLFPILCFNREFLELKTHTYTLSFFDIYLFSTTFYIGIVSFFSHFLVKKVRRDIFLAILVLISVGLLQVIFHNKPENTNGFFIVYLYPLLYFLIIAHVDFDIGDVRRALFTMLLISVSIFVLQNIYIGPLVVYHSSVDQTWLSQKISIANGGLLEIGAMELFLSPISFYILWNYQEIKATYSQLYTKILTLSSLFVIMMPFIYHNRANSLVVLSFAALFVINKIALRKVILFFSSVFPFLGYYLYNIVVSRSFVSDGKEIDVFGFLVSGIDSTTYDHLNSTMLGIDALMHNLLFGVGLLTGPNSIFLDDFNIGNMRNFIFPVAEVAISMGGVFFLSYVLLVASIYRSAQSPLMKYLLLLQFIPVIGANKFFSAYATGSFPIKDGFYGLSDFSPIAITSISSLYIYLLCTNDGHNVSNARDMKSA